jgi:hypothetical protein
MSDIVRQATVAHLRAAGLLDLDIIAGEERNP